MICIKDSFESSIGGVQIGKVVVSIKIFFLKDWYSSFLTKNSSFGSSSVLENKFCDSNPKKKYKN